MNNCTKSKETKIDSHSYILSTGEIDVERLTIMNELFNPLSLDFLKLKSEMSVLTIGCGLGLLEIEIAKKIGSKGKILATDISEQQLAIARKNIEQAMITSVNLMNLDIAHLDVINEKFDRIHCRFVLSHMSLESVKKLIPLLMSKLSAEGALVIEEVSSLDSLTCEPFSEEYELWKAYIDIQWNLQGADRSPGISIYKFLYENGYHFKHHTYQPVLKTKREKSILSLGIRSLAQGFINKKVATAEQIEEVIKKVEELEDNENAFPNYCGASQFFLTHSAYKES